MNSLWDRIRERKLVQWALAYLAGGWLVLQVVDLLADNLGWPAWVFRVAIALLSVGFLAVLVLAWYHGEQGRQRVSGMEVAMLAGILVMAGGVVTLVRGDAGPAAERSAAAGRAGEPIPSEDAEGKPSIAVLPLENLSPDPENAYFADGIHEEILTRLHKIGSLRVISRTSVMGYRDRTRNLRTIGREIGASHILEGSVRWAGDRVRITTQLIDARSDEHLWAETYERELADVFQIQTDVAERVARSLDAELTSDEERRLGSRPTENLEAYQLHLRARELVRQSLEPANQRAAMALWERAVSLDPDFALAHAYLAIHHALSYSWHRDDSPERLERARRAAERAVELDPDLAEAHMAMARYYYRGLLDYQRALEELEIARSLQSSNAEVLQTIAAVRRRQGRFREALELQEEARKLDPRNPVELWQIAITQRFLREYVGANRSLDRAIELSPTYRNPYSWKAENLVLARGDVDGALAVLREWEMVGGDADDWLHRRRGRLRFLQRDYQGALEEHSALPEDRIDDDHLRYTPHHLRLAEVHRHLGDREAARRHYRAAAAHLERKLGESPDDPRLHGALGLAYVGLGRGEEAVTHGRRAVELMPVEREAFRGPQRLEELARIYADVGRSDEAVATLRRLLELPSFLSRHLVRLDPRWDALREHPGFRALLEESRAARVP